MPSYQVVNASRLRQLIRVNAQRAAEAPLSYMRTPDPLQLHSLRSAWRGLLTATGFAENQPIPYVYDNQHFIEKTNKK